MLGTQGTLKIKGMAIIKACRLPPLMGVLDQQGLVTLPLLRIVDSDTVMIPAERFKVIRRHGAASEEDQTRGQDHVSHIRNTPNAARSAIGASRHAARASPSTSRV